MSNEETLVFIVKPKSEVPKSRPKKGLGLTLKSGGQRDQGHGVVLHVQEEVYQSTLYFRRRVAWDQE